MQSWTELQRELLPRGYASVDYVQFICREHGGFRAGLAQHTRRWPCPPCGHICRPTPLAKGITRLQLPIVESAAGLRPHRGVTYHLRPKLQIGKSSKFERVVRKLKLRDQESQIQSAPLRVWAKNHRLHDYVPEWLLSAWRMPVFEKDACCSPNKD